MGAMCRPGEPPGSAADAVTVRLPAPSGGGTSPNPTVRVPSWKGAEARQAAARTRKLKNIVRNQTAKLNNTFNDDVVAVKAPTAVRQPRRPSVASASPPKAMPRSLPQIRTPSPTKKGRFVTTNVEPAANSKPPRRRKSLSPSKKTASPDAALGPSLPGNPQQAQAARKSVKRARAAAADFPLGTSTSPQQQQQQEQQHEEVASDDEASQQQTKAYEETARVAAEATTTMLRENERIRMAELKREEEKSAAARAKAMVATAKADAEMDCNQEKGHRAQPRRQRTDEGDQDGLQSIYAAAAARKKEAEEEGAEASAASKKSFWCHSVPAETEGHKSGMP